MKDHYFVSVYIFLTKKHCSWNVQTGAAYGPTKTWITNEDLNYQIFDMQKRFSLKLQS